MSELKESRNDAYDNPKIFKARTKAYHDHKILRKTIVLYQKVFLYNSHLRLFPRKLQSRWTGPFFVKIVFPYGAVEIEDPKNGNIFEVDGHRLKSFISNFEPELESIPLDDPNYESH